MRPSGKSHREKVTRIKRPTLKKSKSAVVERLEDRLLLAGQAFYPGFTLSTGSALLGNQSPASPVFVGPLQVGAQAPTVASPSSTQFPSRTPVSRETLLAQPGVGELEWNGHDVIVKKGQYIVQFNDLKGTPAQQVQAAQKKLAGSGIPYLSTQYLGLTGMILLDVPQELPFKDLKTALRSVSGLTSIEPNIIHLNVLSQFPNDPGFDQLYGLNNTGQTILGSPGTPDADIDAPEAWDITTGSSSVIVADIDTGIDYNHEDLAANMWTNPGEVPNNGIDDDGNGFVDDYYGYDFINGDSDPMDDFGHGTHTAGTIGAVGDNGIGVTGVNWNVKLMALKWIAGDGFGTTAAAVQAINYATQMRLAGANVKVSSNSWHVFEDSPAMHDAIVAHGDAGILFVLAAGNDGQNRDVVADYPSSYNLPNMLTVAATDNNDLKAGFSAYGLTTVHLGAPGVSTLSTTPGNTYSYFDGTSMATPHVAGVAALAWSIAPNATWQTIRAAILAGVDPIPALATDGPTPVATGGRLNAYNTLLQLGLTVISTSPAAGEIVAAPPTTFTINFSDVLDPSTVDPSDLFVNGIPANSVALSNGDTTATFTYTVSPVTAQGLQTMELAEGSMERISDQDGLQGFSATFRYDLLRMEVVSTDPASGSTVLLPLNSIVVNLNEPYDPASVSAADLGLSTGTVVGFNLLDIDSIEFLVAGIDAEGTLTFSIAAGALTDQYGNPNLPFTGSVSLDFGVVPFPVPTVVVEPRGGLIYSTSKTGIIAPVGDEDSFTIRIDPGQRITVLVTPIDPALKASVTLSKVVGGVPTVVGSATAAGAGDDAVIQSILAPGNLWATTPQTDYVVTVTGADGTAGAFRVSLILNSSVENEDHGGATNDSLGTAQSLDGSFVNIAVGATNTAASAGVLGSVRGGATAGDAIVGVRSFNFFGGSIVRYDQAGNLVQTISSPEFDRGVISDVELGPDNVIYVALSTSFNGPVVSGEVLKFDLGGAFLGSIILPDDPTNIGYLYPFGFDVAADGSLWVPQLNNGDLVHVGADGSLLGTYPVGLQPQDATVGSDGLVYVSKFNGAGSIVQVDPGSGSISDFVPFTGLSPVMINATADGKLWLAEFADGAIRYDGSASVDRFVGLFSTIDPQQTPDDGLWVAGFQNGLYKFDSANNFQFQTFTPNGNAIALAVLGVDSPDPLPAVDTADLYSFSLTAGGTVTVTADLLGGNPLSLELLDSSGNIVAIGAPSGAIDAAIDDYVVTAAGTYYARVTGKGAQYSLHVTRNAGFDIGNNDSIATAQEVVAPVSQGKRNILGYAGGNSVVLQAIDSGWYVMPDGQHDPSNQNYFTGLASGFGVLRNFFAFDTSGLSGTILSGQFRAYNPGLGAGDFGDGFGSSDPTETYAIFDVTTDIGQLLAGGSGLPGIWDDLGSGIGYGSRVVSSADNGTLITIDLSPAALADLSSKLGGLLGVGGALTTLDGNPGDQFLFSATFNDLNYPRQLALDIKDTDFYRVDVAAGAGLTINTLTPAGGAGELVNNLDPLLRLYDSDGNLLRTNDNGAGDGRNALIAYTNPKNAGTKTFYIQVDSVGTATGEYVLQIGQSRVGLDTFEVAATDPTAGERVRGPQTTITVDFNDLVALATIQASDLTVDGIPASGFTVIDGDTVAFDVSGISLGEGDHTIAIGAGAIYDLQNTPLAAFSSSFYNDITAPRVIDSSIQEGDILDSAGSLVYQVIFSEAMDTSVIDTSDVSLFGLIRGTFYQPNSISFDSTGTIATITFDSIADDYYTLYLGSYSGGFQDTVGNILDGEPLAWPIPPNESGDGFEGGSFYVNFAIDLGVQALPVPLVPVDPRGSLIYQSPSQATGTSVFPGDTDDYTISLDAGQTVTVLIFSATTDLQLSVFDPDGVQLGITLTTPAGVEGVFQATAITGEGTYRFNLGSVSGVGLYSIFLVANAAVEDESHGGPSNNDIPSAQDLANSFIALAGGADRGAVLGRTDAPTGGGFAFEVEPNQPPPPIPVIDAAQNVDAGGWNTNENGDISNSTVYPHISINATGDDTFDYYVFTVDVAGSFASFDIDYEDFDTELFLYDAFGNLLASNDDDGGDPGSGSGLASYLEGTFSEAGTYIIGVGRFDSFDVGGQIGGSAPPIGGVYTLHISIENHALVDGEDPVAEVEPNHPAAADVLSYAQNLDGEIFSLDPNFDITDSTVVPHLSIAGSGDGTFDYYSFTVGVSSGRTILDIDYENFDTMLYLYDAFGTLIASSDDNGSDPGSGSGFASLIDTVLSAGTYYVGVARYFAFDAGGQLAGDAPEDGHFYTLHVSIQGATVPPATSDYYAFELTEGQSVSLALASLTGQPVHVELLDAAGNVVASGLETNELIANGSFESGDFTGWTVGTTGTPFVDWTVSTAGAGSGFFPGTAPRDGIYSAWNGFDGDGPMQYTMYQDVTIPVGASPTLTWQDHVQWDFSLTGTATAARIYDVQILDPVTSTVLETLYSFSTGTDLIIGDTGWQSHSADLSAYAGQTVRLLFSEDIPESFTGPGQIEFDDISMSLGGPGLPTNLDDLISGFVAPTTGTYYARVFGTPFQDYSLVVLRGAEFDAESNDTPDTAQALTISASGEGGALGYIAPRTGGSLVLEGSQIRLGIHNDGSFVSDNFAAGIQFDGVEFVIAGTPLATFTIERNGEVFPNGGAIGLTSIPVSVVDASFGTTRAVRITGIVGGNLEFVRVISFEADAEFAVITTTLTNISGSTAFGVAWLENIDPDQGTAINGDFATYNDVVFGSRFVRASYPGGAWPDGLTIGLGSSDTRAVVSAEGFANFFPFDIINSPVDPDGALDDVAINLAFDFGDLAPGGSVTGSMVMAFGRSVDEADATYFANADAVAVAGPSGDADVYSLVLAPGQTLDLSTITPGGGPGEFVNDLDPMIVVRDANGVVVAYDDNSASDGRNAALSFVVPDGAGGTYYISVLSSDINSTTGEYFLSVNVSDASIGSIAGFASPGGAKPPAPGLGVIPDLGGLPGVASPAVGGGRVLSTSNGGAPAAMRPAGGGSSLDTPKARTVPTNRAGSASSVAAIDAALDELAGTDTALPLTSDDGVDTWVPVPRRNRRG